MLIKVSCPNPACGRALSLREKFAGKKVRCPQCRAVIFVPGASAAQAAAARTGGPAGEAAGQAGIPHPFHPARQVCTNCGAVLGVRDATCPSCGGDVRSGVTVMRITADEKKRAGLFGILPWMRTKKRGRRRSGGKLLAALFVLIVIGAAVLGTLYFLRKTRQGGPSAPQAQPAEQPAPGAT